MAKMVRLTGVTRYVKVKGSSTANLAVASALVNGLVHDGVTYATGDRMLLKNQSTPAENGIYTIVASGAAPRTSDWATGADVRGMAVRVYNGTAGAPGGVQKVWAVYAEPAIVGTHDPEFIRHERNGV